MSRRSMSPSDRDRGAPAASPAISAATLKAPTLLRAEEWLPGPLDSHPILHRIDLPAKALGVAEIGKVLAGRVWPKRAQVCLCNLCGFAMELGAACNSHRHCSRFGSPHPAHRSGNPDFVQPSRYLRKARPWRYQICGATDRPDSLSRRTLHLLRGHCGLALHDGLAVVR